MNEQRHMHSLVQRSPIEADIIIIIVCLETVDDIF